MVSLVLDEEGSSSAPASISKVPGTSYSPSTSSSSTSGSSSSSSTSSKSLTELGGGNGNLFGSGQPTHVSTQTVTCTKSTRKTIVHTKDGPVERVEEVMEGGPECRSMTDLPQGGFNTFFPGFSHTSSSFSSGTKSVHAGGSKTVHSGSTDFGVDLGLFVSDDAEEDLPDFHARSVKSGRVERQADYIGKGTKTSDLE